MTKESDFAAQYREVTILGRSIVGIRGSREARERRRVALELTLDRGSVAGIVVEWEWQNRLIHVLATWSRRPAEGDVAYTTRYSLCIEFGEPVSGRVYLIFVYIASVIA